MPQDTGFSSLFLKVLMQMLQWLDGPAGEGGPLQAQLKLFAAQCSARRKISDGEVSPGGCRPLGSVGPQVGISVDMAQGLEKEGFGDHSGILSGKGV